MKIITRQTLANEAAKRWRMQYRRDDPLDRGIGKKLAEMGPAPNPDKIDELIGNNSWTKVPRCQECFEMAENNVVVRLGIDCALCLACLEKAVSYSQFALRPTGR